MQNNANTAIKTLLFGINVVNGAVLLALSLLSNVIAKLPAGVTAALLCVAVYDFSALHAAIMSGETTTPGLYFFVLLSVIFSVAAGCIIRAR